MAGARSAVHRAETCFVAELTAGQVHPWHPLGSVWALPAVEWVVALLQAGGSECLLSGGAAALKGDAQMLLRLAAEPKAGLKLAQRTLVEAEAP